MSRGFAAAIVGGLLFTIASIGAAVAAPPFFGTIFHGPDTIKDTDYSTFQSVTYRGVATRFVFDRRVDRFLNVSVHLFDARYTDGRRIEFQVNREFSPGQAQVEAQFYAEAIGRIPTGLRQSVRTTTIHRGNELFGGNGDTGDVLIHTGSVAQGYIRDSILEEVLVHEATHVALDLPLRNNAAYAAAQQRDGGFISTNAQNFPDREDVAESYLTWMQARFRAGRVSASDIEDIERAIPNRLAFFDTLNLNLFPFEPTVTTDFVHLATDFRGPNMRLDVINGGSQNNTTRLTPANNYSGQFWRFVPSERGGYRLVTLFRGDNMCLDVFASGSRAGQPYLRPCSTSSGRDWQVRVANSARFRLTTQFNGREQCLDIFNGGASNNMPRLSNCANYSGQFWSITRTAYQP
ncbi:MAG: ricin-type beta-trefoil lectin domain protein [Pseudomonadota bacterium]